MIQKFSKIDFAKNVFLSLNFWFRIIFFLFQTNIIQGTLDFLVSLNSEDGKFHRRNLYPNPWSIYNLPNHFPPLFSPESLVARWLQELLDNQVLQKIFSAPSRYLWNAVFYWRKFFPLNIKKTSKMARYSKIFLMTFFERFSSDSMKGAFKIRFPAFFSRCAEIFECLFRNFFSWAWWFFVLHASGFEISCATLIIFFLGAW